MIKPPLIALVALVAAASAACADLPDVTGGTCGNGVLEPENGEDCDGAGVAGTVCASPGSVDACHYVCSASACPDGMACGADQRCRAPSAQFHRPGDSAPFLAIDLAAGDVDADGIADLVGVSDTAMTVRFGDAAGSLAVSTTQVVETPTGAAAFGQLDDAPGMDVVIPTALGLFSQLATGRTYEAFAYSSFSIDTTANAIVVGAQREPAAASNLLGFVGSVAIYLDVEPAPVAVCLDGTVPATTANPCPNAHDTGDLLGAPLVGKLGYDAVTDTFVGSADVTDEVVVAFKAATSVALWSARSDTTLDPKSTGPRISLVQVIALPGNLHVATDGALAFGRFDHDACMDLEIPIQHNGVGQDVEGFVIAYGAKDGAGACTGKFDPATTDGLQTAIPVGALTAGVIPRVVVDLDGDGLSDVVTNQLIVRTTCARDVGVCGGHTGHAPIATTPRTWSRAVATDFNGDQRVDLAGAVDGEASVDAMLGVGGPLFNRFAVATDAPVRELVTADFDGDLVGDLAIVTGDPQTPDEDDELAVAYGQATGGPTAPVTMGHFGKFESLSLVFLPNVVFDVLADVLLIAKRNGNRRISGLYGSSTRRLLAPYQLTHVSDVIPTAILLGHYDAQAGTDVLALAPGELAHENVVFLSGTGDGDLTSGPPRSFGISEFGFDDAVWASGPIQAGATTDTVIGVDQAIIDHTGGLGPGTVALPDGAPRVVAVSPDTGYTPVVGSISQFPGMQARGVQLADLDGDGAADALIELSTLVTSVAVVAWHGDVTSLPTVLDTAAACRAVTPIQLDGDPALELAAICRSGSATTLRLLDWDGVTWQTLADLPLKDSDNRLAAGDFNGDGVVDLAVMSGSRGTALTVRVYLQCPAGDVACLSDAVTP